MLHGLGHRCLLCFPGLLAFSAYSSRPSNIAVDVVNIRVVALPETQGPEIEASLAELFDFVWNAKWCLDQRRLFLICCQRSN